MIDALRYELVRLRTIRSTYWLIGIALALQLLLDLHHRLAASVVGSAVRR